MGSQVRTRTLFTGVTNGTERNDLVAGNYSTPDAGLPSPLGYQNVGEVTDVGPDVTGLKVGDVVFSGVWLVSNHIEYVVVRRTIFSFGCRSRWTSGTQRCWGWPASQFTCAGESTCAPARTS